MTFEQKVAELERELVRIRCFDPRTKELLVSGGRNKKIKKAKLKFFNRKKIVSRLSTLPWKRPRIEHASAGIGIIRNTGKYTIDVYKTALNSKKNALWNIFHEEGHVLRGPIKTLIKAGISGLATFLGSICIEAGILQYISDNHSELMYQMLSWIYKNGLNEAYEISMVLIPTLLCTAAIGLVYKREVEKEEILADNHAYARMKELGYHF